MTIKQLETVLRFAYLNGYSSEQWIEPTKELINQQPELELDLCELLLSSLFSFTKVSNKLLESYICYSLELELIKPKTFLSHLIHFTQTTHDSFHQWAFILGLLPKLFDFINADAIVTSLQKSTQDEWVDLIHETLLTLADVVSVGLYPNHKFKATIEQQQQKPDISAQMTVDASSFFNNSSQVFDSQISAHSFNNNNTFDPESTLDIDNTQQVEEEAPLNDTNLMASQATQNTHHSMELEETHKVEYANAITAAQLMIQLIEKKGAKRIFEVRNNQKRQSGSNSTEQEEPWLSCQNKLILNDQKASTVVSQNSDVQKLISLVQRLTDRDAERRMAVHMKYHELEDEGTARAMPSAGVMGLLYHIVQIRPSLEDDYVVDQLMKLQAIKGSFDESFYLELWFAALTGFREACLNTSCQGPPSESTGERDKNCNIIVATNRLLWRCLVLVKLPLLLSKLKERKALEEEKRGDIKKPLNENDLNPLESSLKELKAFTGLVNACNTPVCSPDFFAPSSVALVDNMTFGDDDDDDIMKMIDTMSYTADLNSPEVTKAIRSISSNDIFTNIVQICERYGFVRPEKAKTLLGKQDFMDIEEGDDAALVDQNIKQRIQSLRENTTFKSITELVYIGLVSPIHLRTVVDFILELLQEKCRINGFNDITKIADALMENPCMIDLMVQLYPPWTFLTPLESVLNNWGPSLNSVAMDMDDDPVGGEQEELDGVQLLYNKFSKVWNFVYTVINRFKLYRDIDRIFQNKYDFCYRFFSNNDPFLYGIDVQDDFMEQTTNQWMNGLAGQDGLSDELMSNSRPQDLLSIVPTLLHRCILLYSAGHMEQDAFDGLMSYFEKKFLNFALPSVISTLCDELNYDGHTAIAFNALYQIIMSESSQPHVSQNSVLGALESLVEMKQQEALFYNDEQVDPQLMQRINDLRAHILNNNQQLDSKSEMLHTETVSTGVTPTTLFEKAELMFRYIVKSGRSMFMIDVDADTSALWDNVPKQQVVSHYLDMVLFETALSIGGGHWFVNMIVDQVLEAGKSGGAVRAAELGSCLIATPLLYSANSHERCFNLLRCLLQVVLPSSLSECARLNMSFFQGQTLGVFTSDCLVLMQGRDESVFQLGKYFFEALVIDKESSSIKQEEAEVEEQSEYFSEWDDTIIKSAVWRGFVKGLMSNPMIEEIWPNAFI
ncbi:hypothetical protein K501DRAFT_336268 [Backusella circina FSU 941]|nr:hypothetical protein K501DRAFT_336268 [Backusella circina FSU 941]